MQSNCNRIAFLADFLLLTATSCNNLSQKEKMHLGMDGPTLSTRLENEIQPGMPLDDAYSVLERYGLERATTSSEDSVQFYHETHGPWPTLFRVGVKIIKSEDGKVADTKVTCEGKGP